MKNKPHVLMEHYLVPTGLFTLNICVVHLAYTLATYDGLHVGYLTALIVAFLTLISSLLLKRKGYLVFSIAFYVVILIGVLSGLSPYPLH